MLIEVAALAVEPYVWINRLETRAPAPACAALRMPRGQPHRKTSMEPTSRTRRMLIKAGIAGLATPAVAAAQSATTSREGARFNLWVISDCHVGTDKAASAGIQHGLVGFRPPPVYPESLAEALRTSEEGGRFGGPPIEWDIALNLGDYAGFWDAPEDE